MINMNLTNAERCAERLKAPAPEGAPQSDKQKEIVQMKASLTHCTRAIENQLKSGSLTDMDIIEQKQKLTAFQQLVDMTENAIKAANQAKVQDLQTNTIPQLNSMFESFSSQLDKCKDEAALFSSEFKDQLTPEHAMQAKEKTEAELKPAESELKAMKEFIVEKNKAMAHFPGEDLKDLREQIRNIQKKIQESEKEFLKVRASMMTAVNKAKAALAAKQRQEEAEKRRLEMEAKKVFNAGIMAFATQMIQIITLHEKTITELSDADSLKLTKKFMGYKLELDERLKDPQVLPQSKGTTTNAYRKLTMILEKLQKRENEKLEKEEDELRRAQILIATKGRELKGDTDDETFFKKLTAGASMMKLVHYVKFIAQFDIAAKGPALWKRSTQFIDKIVTEISQDDFYLNVLSHTYKVIKPTILTPSEEFGEGINLELETYIQLIDGPKEVGALVRAKARAEKGDGEDPQEGWITLRGNNWETIIPFYPHFTSVGTTVLTDEFDIKKFNVKKHIHEKDEIRATGVPKILVRDNAEDPALKSTMLRVKAEMKNATKDCGWITLKGNKGSPLFTQELPKKEEKNDVEATPFSQADFDQILTSILQKSMDEVSTDIEDYMSLKEKIGVQILELKAMDDEGSEPTQDEIKASLGALDQNLNDASRQQKNINNKIQQATYQINQAKTPDTETLKEKLTKMQEEMSAAVKHLVEERQTKQTVGQSVSMKEAERRRQREKVERDELVVKIEAEIQPHNVATQEGLDEVAGLSVDTQDAMVAAATLHEKHTEVSETLDKLTVTADAATKWYTDMNEAHPDIAKFAKQGGYQGGGQWNQGKGSFNQNLHPALSESSRNVTLMHQKATRLTKSIGVLRQKLTEMDVQIVERQRVELALQFAKICGEKTNPTALFTKNLKKGATSMKFEEFENFLQSKVKSHQPRLKLLLEKFLHLKEEDAITESHVRSLSSVFMKISKPVIMTNILEVRNLKCEEVHQLQSGSPVKLLEDYQKDEETQLVRFLAKDLASGKEGYVTAKGNKAVSPSKFCIPLKGFWKCIKAVDMTDDKNEVKRDIMAGEYLRCIEAPEQTAPGLMRAHVLCLLDDSVGWVTLFNRNKGEEAVYLMNCDLPAEMPTLEDLQKAHEDLKAKEQAAKEAAEKRAQDLAERKAKLEDKKKEEDAKKRELVKEEPNGDEAEEPASKKVKTEEKDEEIEKPNKKVKTEEKMETTTTAEAKSAEA